MDFIVSEDSELKKKLKSIEFQLDDLNGNYGTKEGYCIFCNSIEYNSVLGIIHDKDCIMIKIREKILEMK